MCLYVCETRPETLIFSPDPESKPTHWAPQDRPRASGKRAGFMCDACRNTHTHTATDPMKGRTRTCTQHRCYTNMSSDRRAGNDEAQNQKTHMPIGHCAHTQEKGVERFTLTVPEVRDVRIQGQ